MTALSMNAGSMNSGYSVADNVRAALPQSVAVLPSRLSLAVEQASARVNDWALDHLLDAAGGMSLALLPFSFLAWMFITR